MDVNTPRSVPTKTCWELLGLTTTDKAGICGIAVRPLPTLGDQLTPPLVVLNTLLMPNAETVAYPTLTSVGSQAIQEM